MKKFVIVVLVSAAAFGVFSLFGMSATWKWVLSAVVFVVAGVCAMLSGIFPDENDDEDGDEEDPHVNIKPGCCATNLGEAGSPDCI